ncbi:MAG: hypothetical protein LAP21_10765 [Acidobacteriia bacterium]|nr:hypothetical protein [Terriglobia bacterium]
MLTLASMRFNPLTTIWLGGIFLQSVLAVVVLTKRVWKRFPSFALYFLTNLAMSGVLIMVSALQAHSAANAPNYAYFYCYWGSQCVVLILGLGVVFEIFTHLFAPYAALKKTAETVFRCSALLLLVCGAVVILARPHGESGLSAFFVVTEEVVRLIEVGLVAFLFLSAGLFGLHWRQSEFGIALGMGSYAIVDLVTMSLRGYFGKSPEYALNVCVMFAFDISVLVWMGYLRSPQVVTENNIEVPEQDQLEQWNKALTEFIYQ